jgi:hypothetical protein
MRSVQLSAWSIRSRPQGLWGGPAVFEREPGDVSNTHAPMPFSHPFPCSNYEQLGLKFKLFSAEVLFNKGLSQIYMGKTQEGLADMEDARREKATEEHNVIDDAIQDRGEGYTVFSIVRKTLHLSCHAPL